MEYLTSNIAVAEAAMVAGLKFFAGYPITPASDLFEYLAEKLPERGGVVIQFEDEIASINAAIGASWGGAKSMTATSGPGFSLMVEALSFAIISETPLVIVDIMRAGPSTGVPTKSSQSDVFQVRFGAHGNYEIPVLVPWSAQEAFDLTIKAFNIAEYMRTPVVLLSDAVLAHTWERVVIREPGEVELIERKRPAVPPEEYVPYKPDEDLIPPMADFGMGYSVLVESLAHDERGYYAPVNSKYRELVTRLVRKVRVNIGKFDEVFTAWADDSEFLFFAYGSTARSTYALVRNLRRGGVKAGLFRPKVLWPLNEGKLRECARRAKVVFVVENNSGLMASEVSRILRDREVVSVPVISLDVPSPDEILEFVGEWLR